MHEERRAVIQLVAAACLWSLAGPMIKAVEWNPLAIAGVRSGLAAAMLAVIVRKKNFTWSLPQIGGGIAYATTVVLFVVANKMTTAANAPVWMALFGGWYLNERASRADWAMIGLLLGGMTLFFMDDLSIRATWGNVLAIISGCSWAWLGLFMRKQRGASPVESVFLGNILAAVIGLPFCLGSLPRSGGSVALAALVLVCLGVFQLGLSYVLYSKAIRHVTAMEAILVTALEPILNPLMVLILFAERPGFWAAVGGSSVIVCVFIRAAATWRRTALRPNGRGG
jgi:drug/metabolite transporter (DMT)-like permease